MKKLIIIKSTKVILIAAACLCPQTMASKARKKRQKLKAIEREKYLKLQLKEYQEKVAMKERTISCVSRLEQSLSVYLAS